MQLGRPVETLERADAMGKRRPRAKSAHRAAAPCAAAMAGVALLAAAGCAEKKPTELVAGVTTQVQVPKELKSVRIDVQSGGTLIFCRAYRVTDGFTHLPKTLGMVSGGNPKEPVTITVTGYVSAEDEPSAPDEITQCATFAPSVKAGEARVLRSARQPYVQDKVLFLPMPLRFSCFEKSCDPGETCLGGECKAPDVDPAALALYADDLIYGNANTCFSPATCLVDAQPPQVVDADDCVYALPGTASAPPRPDPDPFPALPTTGSGVNVEVVYDGFVTEVLDLDRQEGFFIPDPSKPQQFQLASGLCHRKGDGGHLPIALKASGLCPPKTVLQPVCDNENPANPDGTSSVDPGPTSAGGDVVCSTAALKPAPSALLVLMDASKSMAPFFGPAGVQQILGLSVQDPVFATTQVALRLLPSDATDCGSADNKFGRADLLTVPFSLAGASRTSLVSVLQNAGSVHASDDPLFLDAALESEGAYKLLRDLRAQTSAPFNRSAVLLLGNRSLWNGCADASHATPEDEARAAKNDATNPIYTYVVLLETPPGADLGGRDLTQTREDARLIAAAGGSNLFDATVDHLAGLSAFNTVVADLGSCLYEAPSDAVRKDSPVSYVNPLTLERNDIPFNAACTDGATAAGWSQDASNRIRVCGQSCQDLRDVLQAVAAKAFSDGQRAPEVPLFAPKVCP